jgi:hypothetical protein
MSKSPISHRMSDPELQKFEAELLERLKVHVQQTPEAPLEFQRKLAEKHMSSLLSEISQCTTIPTLIHKSLEVEDLEDLLRFLTDACEHVCPRYYQCESIADSNDWFKSADIFNFE